MSNKPRGQVSPWLSQPMAERASQSSAAHLCGPARGHGALGQGAQRDLLPRQPLRDALPLRPVAVPPPPGRQPLDGVGRLCQPRRHLRARVLQRTLQRPAPDAGLVRRLALLLRRPQRRAEGLRLRLSLRLALRRPLRPRPLPVRLARPLPRLRETLLEHLRSVAPQPRLLRRRPRLRPRRRQRPLRGVPRRLRCRLRRPRLFHPARRRLLRLPQPPHRLLVLGPRRALLRRPRPRLLRQRRLLRRQPVQQTPQALAVALGGCRAVLGPGQRRFGGLLLRRRQQRTVAVASGAVSCPHRPGVTPVCCCDV